MRRGTTSTHTFTVPFLITEGQEVVLNYKQDNYDILEKRGDDLQITPHTSTADVVLNLSQEETFLFRPGYANVQMRIYGDGVATASDICFFEVKDSLSNEVLTGG